MNKLAEWPRAPMAVPHIVKSAAFIPGLLATLVVPPGLPLAVGYFLVSLFEGKWIDGLFALVMALVVMGGLVFATVSLRRKQYAEIQQERDAFANAVADLLLAGQQPPPFSLYLRPFFTDGHLTADEGIARYLTFEADEIADIGQKRDMERAAAKALEGHAPLISLGRPNTRLGAGRIETEDANWKALFDQLIAHASRVIMVPIGQPATLEEIHAIASTPELLEKTVFVLPKDRRNRRFAFRPDESIKTIGRMWDHTRQRVIDVLPAFPRFAGGARLVTFAAPDRAVEFRGNGICSVQQPSAIKRFLTQGKAGTLDWLMLPVLFLAGSVAQMNFINVGFPPPAFDPYGSMQSVVEGSVGRFFLQNVVILPMLMIAVYKLVTGDLPRRIGRPMGGALMLFSIGSIVFSIWMNTVVDGGSQSDPFDHWLSHATRVLANLTNGLATYAAVALILQRDMRKTDLLIIVLLAAIMVLRREILPLDDIETRADPRWIADFVLGAALTAVPMMLPMLRAGSRMPRWLAVAAPIVTIVVANLLFVFALWPNYIEWVVAGMCETTYGEEGLACATAQVWTQIGWYFVMGAVHMALVIGMALAIRRYTGLGQPQRWADPLPPYDAG